MHDFKNTETYVYIKLIKNTRLKKNHNIYFINLNTLSPASTVWNLYNIWTDGNNPVCRLALKESTVVVYLRWKKVA